jgi:hypothetical protein
VEGGVPARLAAAIQGDHFVGKLPAWPNIAIGVQSCRAEKTAPEGITTRTEQREQSAI